MKEKIRNIGIIAHIDAGKTTTTEHILFYTGKNHRIGEVDKGSATMDWMEQEQNRGITIVAAATTCFWRDTQINLIDTPGHIDFSVEVERSLRVLDAAVTVLCAVKGIEPQTETVWRQSGRYKVPHLFYINKMDRAGADFQAVLRQLEKKFQACPVPLYLPIGSEASYEANLDVLHQREVHFSGERGETVEYRPIRPEYREQAAQAYENVIDLLSREEDQIAELYLEEKPIPLELCHQTIRRLTIERKVQPVFCGSSLKNKGLQPLLDGVVDYLPAPDELPAPVVSLLSGNTETQTECPPDSSAPAVALIFKVQFDKEMGMLCFVRVYSGTLKPNTTVLNVRKEKKERINRLITMHANSHQAASAITAGNIGVIVGFKLAQTGDTICAEKQRVLLEPISFAEPVISIATEAQSAADAEKLERALEYLEREDPTFRAQKSEETGQLILSGMGELHLEVLCARLRDEYKLNIRTGKPRVSKRETILKPAIGTGKFSHEIAKQLHELELTLKLAPIADNHSSPNTFTCELPKPERAALAEKYRLLIEEAVLRNLESGLRMGYPAINIAVTLTHWSCNSPTPYEPAFEAAAAYAIDNALESAESQILEPVMKISITSPSEYVGDVIGHLTQRSGQILNLENEAGGYSTIQADARLSELFGYSTALRSQTQGRASFSMEFSHFAPVPSSSS